MYKEIRVRRWREEDLDAIVECHAAAYSDYPEKELYGASLFRMQWYAFPEGQLLAEADGEVVGYATSLIVQLDDETEDYDYQQITGGATFSTHDPAGDTLYGADIAVIPEVRGQGISGHLYEARRALMRHYNLRRLLAFGRLPGYRQVAGKMTATQYVDQVVRGERKDSALSAHLKAGYRVRKVRFDFMSDPSSNNYSTLIEMPNDEFHTAKRAIAAAPIRRPFRRLRVCAAQYLFRAVQSWEDIERNIDFFVSTADEYNCHFLVLPELFTAQYFSTLPRELDIGQAISRLADQADAYIETFRRFATNSQLYIIAGSTPVRRDGKLYNVAHFFTPSGKVYTQDKLHITPAEREYWGIEPGEGLRVFETPFGRIAIQVCYDVEFPESIRLLAAAGVEALFVPFSTDDKKAYYRVRYTAQARAIENIMYVVLAGNCGNLPSHNYLINYAESAIFTPSDFGFPPRAIAAEADPNIETVAIADLDFASLAQTRDVGSVRPWLDRRPDLYTLSAAQKLQIIKTE